MESKIINKTLSTMEHKLHRHVKLEIQNDLPLDKVIVDEEFKPLFEWYQEIPDIPNHIIVTQEEYYLNKIIESQNL